MEHAHTSRHSFDSYKNYDCTDGSIAADRSNGHFHGNIHNGSAVARNIHSEPSGYNVSGNRYPIPASVAAYQDLHYSHNANIDRSENHSCCHQNPHYECMNSFNGRTSIPKPINGIDYNNFNFPPK